ncbi:DUF2514 family protein [Pseudomonas sp. Fl5BN2]|uniref:DUF2514 family protein n=1 Tax=Pseudomonas sp. Fl5BN2 TaxID=2697652 RepID=UPI0013778F72|nr:DUF2514 family protein [Pseudomonas sp. Fl5BN2]
MFSAYGHGNALKDAEWQARWSTRQAGDRQARALAEREEREKEQARQSLINQAVLDG